MNIPLEQPQSPDIYSFGFDGGLNRTLPNNSTGVVYDTLEQALNTGQVLSGGNLALKTLDVGSFTRSVSPGDNIQDAINAASSRGGGRIVLRNGTYKLKTNLTMWSNVYLEGENAHTTILDFIDNASGIVASGSNAYSTGSVTVSNNSTTVTGAGGTAWLTNVAAGQYILLGGIWYLIGAVTANDTIILGVPYGGTALSGAIYVTAIPIDDIKITRLLIKNALTAIAVTYCSRLFFDDISIQSSVVGMSFTDSSLGTIAVPTLIACNSGVTLTRTHYTQIEGGAAIDVLAGNGFTMDTCTNLSFPNCVALNASADGFNITSCSNINLNACSVVENAGQGIEFVSGNSDIVVLGGAMENNGSDGIRLTASTDNCQFIGNSIKDNGGYGINVAAATDDTNLLLGNNFATNTSGAVNNSGTGTLIRSNIGVADN